MKLLPVALALTVVACGGGSAPEPIRLDGQDVSASTLYAFLRARLATSVEGATLCRDIATLNGAEALTYVRTARTPVFAGGDIPGATPRPGQVVTDAEALRAVAVLKSACIR